MMIYTGIGPRNAPPKVLEVCEQIGAHMAKRNWILRTGAGSNGVSSGCDLAFRKGCENVVALLPEPLNPLIEVYCNSESPSRRCLQFYKMGPATHKFFKGSAMLSKALVRGLHPLKKRLSPDYLELHSRNVHQQIGANCCDFLRSHLTILWTPRGEPTDGGTGMSQKIYDILPGRSSQFNIGIFDLDNPTDLEAMWAHLNLIVHSLESE